MRIKDFSVPADVPKSKIRAYVNNYYSITHNTGRLMLFAGDQKVEHMNNDFYGKGIAEDDADPGHLFRIADRAKIGVFATQLGLIARYGRDFPHVPYLVKLNSKTNLVKTGQMDPYSSALVDVDQVVEFKKNSRLKIHAVGYTIYLGSENEAAMLREASQVVYNAHKNGLVTVLWIYPRGKAVKDEKDPHLISGATGVAACLGSDFVKVSYPKKGKQSRPKIFREAVVSAGRTKVVCAGGSSTDPKDFLQRLYEQIHMSGASGNATGRNVHQKPLDEAVAMCNAIYAITIQGKTVDEAVRIYKKA